MYSKEQLETIKCRFLYIVVNIHILPEPSRSRVEVPVCTEGRFIQIYVGAVVIVRASLSVIIRASRQSSAQQVDSWHQHHHRRHPQCLVCSYSRTDSVDTSPPQTAHRELIQKHEQLEKNKNDFKISNILPVWVSTIIQFHNSSNASSILPYFQNTSTPCTYTFL
jgi:hypothetical protein